MDLEALSVTGMLVVLAVVSRHLVDRVGPGKWTWPDATCPQGWAKHTRRAGPVRYHGARSGPGLERTQARPPDVGQDVTQVRTLIALPTSDHRGQRQPAPLTGRFTRPAERTGERPVTAKHTSCSCPQCPARGAWWSSHAGGPG